MDEDPHMLQIPLILSLIAEPAQRGIPGESVSALPPGWSGEWYPNSSTPIRCQSRGSHGHRHLRSLLTYKASWGQVRVGWGPSTSREKVIVCRRPIRSGPILSRVPSMPNPGMVPPGVVLGQDLPLPAEPHGERHLRAVRPNTNCTTTTIVRIAADPFARRCTTPAR